MRFLLGLVFGALLTVGIAFVSDTWTAPAGNQVERRAMVNWDVVGDNLRSVRQHAHEMWSRLSNKVSS
jgi:hypothetical protein